MSTEPRFDPKLLYRRLDSLFGALKAGRSTRRVLESFLEDAFRTLRDDLALEGAYLYGERRDDFTLVKQVGPAVAPPPESVSPKALPLGLVFQHRVYLFSQPEAPESPGQRGLLPPGPAAALVVGRRPHRYVIFFLLREGWVAEELDFALHTVRSALGSRLQDERVRGNVKEAAEIQQSLLLEEPPAFPGYELACRSLAAEEVGGDFYDFLPLGDELMGVAIGDASGQRCLGADDDEVDGVFFGEFQNARTIKDVEVGTFGKGRNACISGGHDQPVTLGVLLHRPGQRMFPPAAAENENVHDAPAWPSFARVIRWAGP